MSILCSCALYCKATTTNKLLEKSLSSGTGKPIGDRKISLQAALIAVPPFCPTETGILWKLNMHARARMCVYVCVCLCVCMKQMDLYDYHYYNIVLQVYV